VATDHPAAHAAAPTEVKNAAPRLDRDGRERNGCSELFRLRNGTGKKALRDPYVARKLAAYEAKPILSGARCVTPPRAKEISRDGLQHPGPDVVNAKTKGN